MVPARAPPIGANVHASVLPYKSASRGAQASPSPVPELIRDPVWITPTPVPHRSCNLRPWQHLQCVAAAGETQQPTPLEAPLLVQIRHLDSPSVLPSIGDVRISPIHHRLAIGWSIERTPWRAPSSPRHACGLNVSEFPHPCAAAQSAWLLGCWGELERLVFCESLHRSGI